VRHGWASYGSESVVLNGFLSRLSYANVVATVAVFLALGGGAYALSGIPDGGGVYHGCVASSGALRVVTKASSCLKAKTVKRGSRRVRIPGESAITWNQQGRPGANGVNGGPGPQGLQGPGGTGPAGSPGASLLTGRFPEGQDFASPSGTTADVSPATDSSMSMLSPAAPIVARDLSVSCGPCGLSGTETVTLTVNGANTALSCPMVEHVPCQDTTHAVTIPPGSTIAIHWVLTNSSGGSAGGKVRFGWRATTP
jgi:hypothetical protein